MGNYLYNGVMLAALPEWDEATYPNAYIMESSLGSGTYALHVSASKLHLNASDYGEMMWEIDASPRLIYSFDTSTWNESISTSQGAYEIDRLLWTNYDILGDDGETVLFAASDPVPVEEDEPKRISLDPTAMLMGWLVGKRVAGLRKTQTDVPVVPDVPIAYLYNGVQLPDINAVWTDKTAYPYAVIVHETAQNFYALSVSNQPWYRQFTYAETYNEGEGVTFVFSSLADKAAWEPFPVFMFSFEDEDDYTTIWANSDVADYDDGTTYLAASEPVPVYE